MCVCVCVLVCRDPETCQKNHIVTYNDAAGDHLTLVLEHFKNDSIKGTQHIPLSRLLKGPIIFLELAHDYLAKQCPTLWFSSHNLPYENSYWSTVCSRALTMPDGRRITAKDFRHMFATAWRDYINRPATQLEGITLHALDAAAADLMCTSTYAFNNSYDDTNRVRGDRSVMGHWKDFREYVEKEYLLKQTYR